MNYAASFVLLLICGSVHSLPAALTTRRRYQYTAAPLVIVRTDNDFVYDAKEDWWAFLTGIIGLGVGLTLLVYVLYTYDLTKLWSKEDPLCKDLYPTSSRNNV